MPIHIWMPIKLLSPRRYALLLLHMKHKGKPVITNINYFISLIYSCIYLTVHPPSVVLFAEGSRRRHLALKGLCSI